MTFSVVMPVFIRNEVSANLPMWERCFPVRAFWYSFFMHGGKASITVFLGSSSSFSFVLCFRRVCLSFSMCSVISFGGVILVVWSLFSMWRRISSWSRRHTRFFVRRISPFCSVVFTSFHSGSWKFDVFFR